MINNLVDNDDFGSLEDSSSFLSSATPMKASPPPGMLPGNTPLKGNNSMMSPPGINLGKNVTVQSGYGDDLLDALIG